MSWCRDELNELIEILIELTELIGLTKFIQIPALIELTELKWVLFELN